MNEFQKAQAQKILASYNINQEQFEKGGAGSGRHVVSDKTRQVVDHLKEANKYKNLHDTFKEVDENGKENDASKKKEYLDKYNFHKEESEKLKKSEEIGDETVYDIVKARGKATPIGGKSKDGKYVKTSNGWELAKKHLGNSSDSQEHSYSIEVLPKDKEFLRHFIPTEEMTLSSYHSKIRREVLRGEDKDDVADFLNHNRWMLGNEKGDSAFEGAKKILDAFRKRYTAKTSKLDKFIEALQVVDSDIKSTKGITVEGTPKGNWAVYKDGKKLTTLNNKMLDEDTIRDNGLEHYEEDGGYENGQKFPGDSEVSVAENKSINTDFGKIELGSEMRSNDDVMKLKHGTVITQTNIDSGELEYLAIVDRNQSYFKDGNIDSVKVITLIEYGKNITDIHQENRWSSQVLATQEYDKEVNTQNFESTDSTIKILADFKSGKLKTIKQKASEANTKSQFDSLVGDGAWDYKNNIYKQLRDSEATRLRAQYGDDFGMNFDSRDNEYEFNQIALNSTLEKFNNQVKS